jgi:hypothetical protein
VIWVTAGIIIPFAVSSIRLSNGLMKGGFLAIGLDSLQ